MDWATAGLLSALAVCLVDLVRCRVRLRELDGANIFMFDNGSFGGPLGVEEACPHCGAQHPVEYDEQDLMAFCDCPENSKSYLVGIGGRKLR